MKRILSLLSVSAVIICCSDLTTDENLSGGGINDITPSTPVEPDVTEDEHLPLVLNFGTLAMSKALVEDALLPNGTSVGITVRDNAGKYTGDDYTNISYTSGQSAGVQVWEPESPVLLGLETGTVFSYWPYSEDEVDGKVIAVTATSDVQTDYMWGLPVGVNKYNRTASITMQHALSAVRIYCKRGSYAGTGEITAVAFGGDCAATGGTLDLTCGALDNLSGQGTMIAPSITAMTLSDSYQKASDIIVVPASGTNGTVVVTLDGVECSIDFDSLSLTVGELKEFYLTVNEGSLSATDITVGDWTYGDSAGNEINVSDKIKITGDIADIAFNTAVSDDGTVTIKAMPTVGELSFTEVEPVTFTGSAILTQSSDIDTGVRTITISDIETDIVVTFDGTIEWDMVAEFEAEANESVIFSAKTWYGIDISIARFQDADVLKPDDHKFSCPVSGIYVLKFVMQNDEIPDDLLYGGDVKTVKISNRISRICNSAFARSKLEKITMPESIRLIEEDAFAVCDSLKTLVLPQNLEYVEYGAFSSCDNLTNIISLAKTAPKLYFIGPVNYDDPFYNMCPNGTLIVPKGSNYTTWMKTDKYYLGYYGWTLIYMNK